MLTSLCTRKAKRCQEEEEEKNRNWWKETQPIKIET